MSEKLPEKYLNDMSELLGDEYEEYLSSFKEKRSYGLRVNTRKISVEDFLKITPFKLEPIPWTHNGFYYSEEDRPAKHPYYYAGLYYLQDPSAMLPAELLPIEEDDIVLDTCAAPGGKSTELLSRLADTGILISNDISASRSQALLKNLELFGGSKYYVMSEDLSKLTKMSGCFDKILIDAPCSGEGMFRKEPDLIRSYREKDGNYYAPIQKSIIENALPLLKDGGMMVYSTCTFSKKEDEDVIRYALSICPELKTVGPNMTDGFVKGEDGIGVKLFPHRIKGEGHFACLLQKGEKKETKHSSQRVLHYEDDFLSFDISGVHQEKIKNKIYLVPDSSLPLDHLRILRSGLLLGEETKYGFEYDGALALYLKKENASRCIDLSSDDDRVMRYLRGETLSVKDLSDQDGWHLVLVDSFPLGFGKVNKGTMKNKYPKGWVMR